MAELASLSGMPAGELTAALGSAWRQAVVLGEQRAGDSPRRAQNSAFGDGACPRLSAGAQDQPRCFLGSVPIGALADRGERGGQLP